MSESFSQTDSFSPVVVQNFNESIVKMLDILNTRNLSMGEIAHFMKSFPFHLLQEGVGLDESQIDILSKILSKFTENNYFEYLSKDFTVVSNCLYFSMSNLNFMLKKPYCEETIYHLLKVLHKVIQFTIKSDKFMISLDKMFGVINDTLRSFYDTFDNISHVCCLLFVELLKSKQIALNNPELYENCVVILIKRITNPELLYLALKEILETRSKFNLPIKELVSAVIDSFQYHCDKFTNQSSVLHYLSLVYLIITTIDAEFLTELFQLLMAKLNWIIDILKSYNNMKYHASYIFIQMVKYEFKLLNVNEEEIRAKLNALYNNNNWEDLNNDLIIIIKYMQFMHTRVHVDKRELSVKLRHVLSEYIPSNPCALKSVYLLYSAYLVQDDKESNFALSDKLLSKLANDDAFENLLSYRKCQLVWILAKGTDVLKIKVLHKWLNNCDNDNDIMAAVEDTNSTTILFDVLMKASEETIKKRATLLLRGQNSNELKLHILKSINTIIHKTDILQYILKFEMVSPNHLEIVACTVKEVILQMSNEKNVQVLKGICTYSLQLLVKTRGEIKVLEPFMEEVVINILISISHEEDHDLAISGINLLSLLIEYSKFTFRTIQAKSTIDYNRILPTKVPARTQSALYLVDSIIKVQKERPIIQLDEYPITLYQKLMSIATETPTKAIFATLVRLLRLKPFLAASNQTVIFLQTMFKKKCNEGIFTFLATWLKIAQKTGFIIIPFEDIAAFLDSVDVDCCHQVLLITKLLNKCQHPPTSIADSNSTWEL